MEFQALIAQRRSLRVYDARQPSRETILTCLEAARIAPSGENIQPWRFTVVDDPELKDELTTAVSSGIYLPTKFIRKAPVIIVVSAKKDILVNRLGTFWLGTQFYLLDTGIACQQLVLAAEAQGLGSCYIGWFNGNQTRKILKIPKNEKLVCLLALGYPPADLRRPKNRRLKPLDEIVRFNLSKDDQED